MNDSDFDAAIIAAAFAQAAEHGWDAVSVAAAARRAGLDLGKARARFSGTAALLLRFGALADQAAFAGAPAVGSVRDRLFDVVMRRIDMLQTHRAGVIALLHALPAQPATALLLFVAGKRSIRWMLEAAGDTISGWAGMLKIRGMLLVWLATVRAWEKDESPDLSSTMRALDQALDKAEKAASWLPATTGKPMKTVQDPSTPVAGHDVFDQEEPATEAPSPHSPLPG